MHSVECERKRDRSDQSRDKRRGRECESGKRREKHRECERNAVRIRVWIEQTWGGN